MCEVLAYDATWIDDNGERSPLTDNERAIIDGTAAGLMGLEIVNEIVQELAGIKSELEQIRVAYIDLISNTQTELIEDELQDIVDGIGQVALLLGV
jgi:endoglucanase Acf2